MKSNTPNLVNQIDHYVIMVSHHNIAEFRACLYLKPKHTHIIVTKPMLNQAKKLARVLKDNNIPFSFIGLDKNIEIENISSNPFTCQGEQVNEIIEWIENDFYPFTEREFSSHQNIVLNMTGGTKSLATVLLHSYPWSTVHYIPFSKNESKLILEEISLDQTGNFKEIQEHDIQKDFNLLDGLKLYCNKVKTYTENKINEHSDSLSIAQLRYNAQTSDEPTQENLFPLITPVLNKIWYKDREKNTIFKKWEDFLPKNNPYLSFDYKTALKLFFERLYNLSPELKNTFKIQDDGINLPPNNNDKSYTPWVKWISGGWFELLIRYWLEENKINPNRIKTGVHIIRDNDADQNETDLLILKHNQLYFIEIKSDIYGAKALSEYLNQILRQSDDMGLVKRVIILSPIVKSTAEKNYKDKWNNFEQLCKAKRIELIIANNKEDLNYLVE